MFELVQTNAEILRIEISFTRRLSTSDRLGIEVGEEERSRLARTSMFRLSLKIFPFQWLRQTIGNARFIRLLSFEFVVDRIVARRMPQIAIGIDFLLR